MKGSLRIGRAFGIGVYLHWTFSLIILWVLFVHLRYGVGWGGALEGVFLVLLIFACVVLHELGHALSARRYGIGTRDITLLPIGGVARLERMPEDPREEFVVAMAGPAVNLVIAGIGALLLVLTSGIPEVEELATAGGHLLFKLTMVNVLLFMFNLLPAFPMDGGRVLRALLGMKLDYVRATRIAAGVGQVMAVFFAFLGLIIPNPFLILIAVFIFLGAGAEADATESRVALRGLRVRDAMITRFFALDHDDTLDRAVALLLAGPQQDFPILRGDDVVGLLTRNQIVKVLSERGRDVPVVEVMTPEPRFLESDDRLEAIYDRLRSSEYSSIPVLEDGRLAGILTLENIGEMVMVRSALRKHGDPVDSLRT